MLKIGLEIHVQLNTKSKIFCSCPTTGSEEPNSRTCEFCLGLPGSKPVFNQEVLNQAVKIALALNCKINKQSFFSRKTYFYPDLPSSYQLTQYETPIATEGKFDNIKIKRTHMEEDPGKLIHESNHVLIDYNRSGIPLVEIVTEPEFTSSEQVRLFLQKLTTTLEYLKVYKRKSESALKVDINISYGGARVEIKNVGSVRDIYRALNYEIKRQKQSPAKEQETRGYNIDSRETFLQRTKESEEDYGYITAPNLTKIEISDKQIKEIEKSLPELEEEKTKRFIKQYKIKEPDAKVLTQDLIQADLFEQVAKKINHKLTTRWFIREIPRILNYNKLTIAEWGITEKELTELLELIQKNRITETTAQKILEKLSQKVFSPKEYVKKQNLELVSNSSDIEKLCDEAIKENQRAVQDYKDGNKISLNFIFGQVMKKSKGTADPYQVKKILEKKLR
ncbi:MAG: Asp-tRNA(Asn)/Glu-tRNA(Gln) amidotransferase subunit GatB [Nanoarchaeota archaeon]